MRRSSTRRRGVRRLGRKFRVSERRSAPRPRAPTSKAHRESAHLIGSVLRLSLLRSWTMDHPYWTRSPRPSCCSSAGESARRTTSEELGTTKAGSRAAHYVRWLPSRRLKPCDRSDDTPGVPQRYEMAPPVASAMHRIKADGEEG